MTTFRANPDERSQFKGVDSALDGLLSAANGERLPGVWGVAQALFNVWTTDPPVPGSGRAREALWFVKALLNSVGVIRTYQRTMEKLGEVREDLIEKFLTEQDLELPKEFDKLGTLIHLYCEDLPRVDRILDPEKRSCVREFTFPSGMTVYYTFSAFDEKFDTTVAGTGFSGHGPYMRLSEITQFYREFSKIVWAREGNADLELSMSYDRFGNLNYNLSNIGEPGDYVSTLSDDGSSVGKLADRCVAFQAKGISRKILFYGSPGCGKTTLARTLARMIGSGHTLRIDPKVISICSAGFVMDFVRMLGPRVVLFDDLDRDEDSTLEILHYMEVAHLDPMRDPGSPMSKMIVIGTVNSIRELDPALLRPGRFDEVVMVKEPSDEHRDEIVRHYLEKFKVVGLTAEDISSKMVGASSADVREVVGCVATVGIEHLDAEVERVMMQRALYAGERVSEWLARRHR